MQKRNLSSKGPSGPCTNQLCSSCVSWKLTQESCFPSAGQRPDCGSRRQWLLVVGISEAGKYGISTSERRGVRRHKPVPWDKVGSFSTEAQKTSADTATANQEKTNQGQMNKEMQAFPLPPSITRPWRYPGLKDGVRTIELWMRQELENSAWAQLQQLKLTRNVQNSLKMLTQVREVF